MEPSYKGNRSTQTTISITYIAQSSTLRKKSVTAYTTHCPYNRIEYDYSYSYSYSTSPLLPYLSENAWCEYDILAQDFA